MKQDRRDRKIFFLHCKLKNYLKILPLPKKLQLMFWPGGQMMFFVSKRRGKGHKVLTEKGW